MERCKAEDESTVGKEDRILADPAEPILHDSRNHAQLRFRPGRLSHCVPNKLFGPQARFGLHLQITSLARPWANESAPVRTGPRGWGPAVSRDDSRSSGPAGGCTCRGSDP